MSLSNNPKLAVIILAAGKGKRMNNPSTAKVMSVLAGKPLIGHVLDTVDNLNPDDVIVVVGYQKDSVIYYINSRNNKKIKHVEQNEQLGTGHAAEQTKKYLENFDGDILILSGDVPLLGSSTLAKFIDFHRFNKNDLSVLSTICPDPTGYGRIVRDSKGNFIRIKEEKDSTPEEKLISEVNSGVYILNSENLFSSLNFVSNKNAQGEYYLTDIVEIMKNNGAKVDALAGADFEELQGVNSPQDLSKAEEFYYKTAGKK